MANYRKREYNNQQARIREREFTQLRGSSQPYHENRQEQTRSSTSRDLPQLRTVRYLEGGSTIRLKKWSSVASRRQRKRCDVTYALLPTVAKFRWFMFHCCGSHCNFATVGNNPYVTSQRSRCLRDAMDDHFLSLIVDSPSRMTSEKTSSFTWTMKNIVWSRLTSKTRW